MSIKYNALIIGAGNIGAFYDNPQSEYILTHAHAFSASDKFELIGFVDTDYNKAKLAADIWRTNVFTDINEAFSKYRIDVVSVAVPDEYHYTILKALVDFPMKVVFAEKPLTKKIEDAVEIVGIYREKGIELMVNYSRRFVPEFYQLKEDFTNGVYGEFLSGVGFYGKGVIHNGSHLIDFIIFLIGDIESCSLLDYEYDYYKDDPSISAILRLKNKKKFIIDYVNCNNYTIFELDFFFEKKRIRITESGFKIEIFNVLDDKDFSGYRDVIKVKEIDTSLGYAQVKAANNIAEYLEFGNKLKCNADDGYNALKICSELRDDIYEK